ncbi:cyclic nucleotide-binding domain-containing protein [Actinomadura rupiterrae]|uniref:cyclic nucleotide-binding domain-containing protein n=1 Tax=Actinomadura rupiterrae TaxID=559627 RepID=UPI0020A49D9B|nr:cyclic nucleotide-binding domain-containing protein [Actinomadura rupiterrae]MCP2337610.1 hypothetical protein [Actinomadura rupiterrae]
MTKYPERHNPYDPDATPEPADEADRPPSGVTRRDRPAQNSRGPQPPRPRNPEPPRPNGTGQARPHGTDQTRPNGTDQARSNGTDRARPHGTESARPHGTESARPRSSEASHRHDGEADRRRSGEADRRQGEADRRRGGEADRRRDRSEDELLAPTQPMPWPPREDDEAGAPTRPLPTGAGRRPEPGGPGRRDRPPVTAAGFGRAPGRAVEGAARPGVPAEPGIPVGQAGSTLSGRSGGGVPARQNPFEMPELPEPVGWAQTGSADFWSALTSVERLHFLRTAEQKVLPAGHVLWRENDLAEDVAVIWSGKVTIRVAQNGVERIVAVRGPGDLIGERAALLVKTRSATVVALDRLTVLRMPVGDFGAFLAAYPRVLAVLDQQMYARLTQVPDDGRSAVPGDARPASPGDPHPAVRGDLHPAVPGDLHPAVPGDLHPAVPGDLRPAIPGDFGSTVPDDLRPAVPGEPVAVSPAPFSGRPPAPAHDWAGQVCSIMFVDVVGFSAPHRNDTDRLELRRVLYEAVPAALEGSDVPWAACYHEDRGDGMLIVVPPQAPPARVVDPMLSLLTARLRRHNHAASEAMRLRIRMSLHIGPVMPDREGVNGAAIIQAARLLDAPELRHRMSDTDADVGFVASEYVFENVLAQGPGYINPRSFQRIRFRAKNAAYTGWMHLSQGTC